MNETEERIEAVERTYRYYEIQGVDPSECGSLEWREMFAIKLEQVHKGGY